MTPERRSTDSVEHRRAVLAPKVMAVAAGILLSAALLVAGWALAKTNSVSHDAQNLARQIQQERARNVRDSCEQTNQRHDEVEKVIARLQRQPIKPSDLTPDQRVRQAKATADFVQALVPRRLCDEYVRNQVRASP